MKEWHKDALKGPNRLTLSTRLDDFKNHLKEEYNKDREKKVTQDRYGVFFSEAFGGSNHRPLFIELSMLPFITPSKTTAATESGNESEEPVPDGFDPDDSHDDARNLFMRGSDRRWDCGHYSRG